MSPYFAVRPTEMNAAAVKPGYAAGSAAHANEQTALLDRS